MQKICGFAVWFSMLVARELEEARLVDHQSRETSWTDRMLLELKRMRDPRIIAATSKETLTGGDMDWWFVRGTVGFCMTIQAKILHYRQKDSLLWHYEDLAHPALQPGFQSRTLVGHARSESRAGRPRYPYYLFYNPSEALSTPVRGYPKFLAGVTLIDGYVVASHIARNLTSSSRFPISAKRFTTLQPCMMTLHELLCAPWDDIPSPQSMIATVDNAWRQLRAGDLIPNTARRLRPTAVQSLPPEIMRVIERGGDRDFRDDDRGLARDTVVFLSD